MKRDLRPRVRRRADALDRHRSLRTTAAVAGLAGTAGFGLMAAMTWSGEPGATPLPANDTGPRAATRTAEPRVVRIQPAPNGGFAQPPTVATPRTGRSQGGHAATGGSN